MWIDKRLEFGDATAFTTTPTQFPNDLDLGSDIDINAGNPLYVVLQVDVAVAGTSPTYDVDLVTDDNTGFASSTLVNSFPQITDVNGTAGARFYIAITGATERYLRLNVTDGGTTPTGTFSAWVTNEQPANWVSYPDAVN